MVRVPVSKDHEHLRCPLHQVKEPPIFAERAAKRKLEAAEKKASKARQGGEGARAASGGSSAAGDQAGGRSSEPAGQSGIFLTIVFLVGRPAVDNARIWLSSIYTEGPITCKTHKVRLS